MDETRQAHLIVRGADALTAALRAVAREPRATVLFCDIDGTISPIVFDPYAAVVPAAFRTALTALAPRLGSLAFVTGRDVRQAAAMVGVGGATYVGLHGFDQMAPDGTVARDPVAEPYVARVQTMARRVAGLDAGRLGLVVENKGPMLDLHYRRAPDPAATLAVLEAEDPRTGARARTGDRDGSLPGGAAATRAGQQRHDGAAPARRPAAAAKSHRASRSSPATTSPTAPASRPSTSGPARATRPQRPGGPAGASPSPSPPSPTRRRARSRTPPTCG